MALRYEICGKPWMVTTISNIGFTDDVSTYTLSYVDDSYVDGKCWMRWIWHTGETGVLYKYK